MRLESDHTQRLLMEIVEIADAEQKSSAVADIIKTLSEWFGIPASNERYIKEVVSKDAFAAYRATRPASALIPASNEDHIIEATAKDDLAANQPVGLIALRYHFQTTAEIWWMGVKPEFHRRGIGALLFDAAGSRAEEKGCRTLAVLTLSPRSPYEPYARTRAFYERQGFRLLIEENECDPQNPLAWMTREVRKAGQEQRASNQGRISD
jgi:ribosomal protein S18 acetylase RimI-like enzyme